MNNQAILRSCRGTKLDRGHSKNVIKNNSGSGTRCPNYPPLHRHGHIAILVDLLKAGGLPLISIFFQKDLVFSVVPLSNSLRSHGWSGDNDMNTTGSWL